MEKIKLIAEIGINHNGDISLAKQLIDKSKECGFDIVKFQKRDINIVYTQSFLDSPRESPRHPDSAREARLGLRDQAQRTVLRSDLRHQTAGDAAQLYSLSFRNFSVVG